MSHCNIVSVDSTNTSNINVDTNIWKLLFDGSKSQEGARASYLLIDPNGKCIIIFCKFEFECTNNIVEYESLVQGLKKTIDLKARCIKSFDDSKIIMMQVKNTIHCHSPHPKTINMRFGTLYINLKPLSLVSYLKLKMFLQVPWKLHPLGFHLRKC
jgi:hypothetical protein